MLLVPIVSEFTDASSLGEVEHRALLQDVTVSLITMFGDQAVLVARGQPAFKAVGHGLGVSWGDVAQALGAEPVGATSERSEAIQGAPVLTPDMPGLEENGSQTRPRNARI